MLIIAPNRKASVLVLVLIVLASMLILSVGLAFRTQIELKLAQSNARRTQAYYLALGGIDRLKALISHNELTPSVVMNICRFNSTAAQEGLFNELEGFEPPNGAILTYNIRDERSLLNIDNSDPASWSNLGFIGEESLAGIIDWTDEDDNTGPGGAETDYYERLEPAYISKNKPFANLKELLLIKGISRSLYTGEDLNRNFLLDDNERDSQFRLPNDNQDDRLDLGLVDIFTVYGDGKININTIEGHILLALQGLDEEVAGLILASLAGSDGQFGTDDDQVIEDAEGISNIEGLTELQVELLTQYCCFDSVYFRVFSSAGTNENFQCSLMATVEFKDNQVRILSLEKLF